MKTDFATAGRIIFGPGKINELRQISKGLGRNAFLVRSKSHPFVPELVNILASNQIDLVEFTPKGEPDDASIMEAVDLARKEECDFVIAFGGGSVIDTGKAVSALLANTGNLMDYLEVVGLGKKLENPSVPCIVIPTTAGTGSEVTRNAVISIPEKRVKVSMRSPDMLPKIALVDPELTHSMPPALTATTGMDAFVQVVEPYVSKFSNPMVDMFCRDAIPRAAKYLLPAYRDGGNSAAREQMAWVSLLGGLSLANAKLGAVHGFAGPLGGMFHAPHGAICAALKAAVMRVNIEVLKKRDAQHFAIDRYKEIAVWMTGNQKATLEDGIKWVDDLRKELKIPSLSAFGIQKSDFEMIIEKARASSSMKGNPILLTDDEMQRILEIAL